MTLPELAKVLESELKQHGFTLSIRKSNLYVFDHVELNYAFDLREDSTSLIVDVVFREGYKSYKRVLLKKYNQIVQSEKIRVLQIPKHVELDFVLNFLLREHLDIATILYKHNLSLVKIYTNDHSFKLKKSKPIKYWFIDGKNNFGDLMSPWLAYKLTERPIINVKDMSHSDGAILGVGSVLQYITANHKNIKVWGSGLITDRNKLNNAKRLKKMGVKNIYACRGELTKDFFDEYNFKHDNVLGDPALLVPDLGLILPATSEYKYAIIPHFMHYHLFKELNIPNCLVINVQDNIFEVVKNICRAEHILSTSLHGIIIAQAFSIPWTHLYINNHLLKGEKFKFNDFFTILDSKNISSADIDIAEINKENMLRLFQKSTVPAYLSNYSHRALLDSFYKSIQEE